MVGNSAMLEGTFDQACREDNNFSWSAQQNKIRLCILKKIIIIIIIIKTVICFSKSANTRAFSPESSLDTESMCKSLVASDHYCLTTTILVSLTFFFSVFITFRTTTGIPQPLAWSGAIFSTQPLLRQEVYCIEYWSVTSSNFLFCISAFSWPYFSRTWWKTLTHQI